jgi:sporulation protein YlmC with PRC-barrel domain
MGDAAGAGDRGTTDANRNNDNANRTNDNNRVNDNNRGGANAAGGNIICVVWVITANSKIVEVQVDANTGKVIGQREGANTNDFGMRTSPVEIPGVNNLPWTAGRPEAALTAMLAVAALGEPKPGQPDQPDRVHNADSMHDFARATRWQKGSDLIGKDITNDSNEDLGKLKDIVVDAKNGRILYGVVTFGGFMGMGNKLFAIPWQSLQLQPDYKKLVLNVPKEQLKNAEGFDESNWPKFADEQWATKTYEFYGHKPYWRTPAGEVASDNYRGRWYHQVSEWAKASDLIGKNVKNPQDEGVGEIKDLAVDPDAGRVIYGILGYSGHRYAIPWQAFDLTGDQKHLVLNVTKTDLDESVAFKGEDWPNLTDEAWSTRIYTHYHVTPYWIDRTND